MNKDMIEDLTRQQIAAFLPDAISQTLKSYYRFAQQEAPEDKTPGKNPVTTREFADYHKACKVAISHIELLIKLARWADLPDAKDEDRNRQIIIAAMINEAQKELEDYNRRQEEKP